jgi:hypothetical protein
VNTNIDVNEIKVTINTPIEFLTELIKLSHIGIVNGEKTPDFHNITYRLIKFIIETLDADLALLLTETLVHIQNNSKFYVTNNATNLNLLCKIILIQFETNKTEIYSHVLTLITYEDAEISRTNIKSIVEPQLRKMNANIYECFNLKLTIKLLKSYLSIDHEEFHTLFLDVLTDWKEYDEQLEEEAFIKLVWFAFILDEEDHLKRIVPKFNHYMKSDNWDLKFYRYIKKIRNSSTPHNEEKLNNVINKFKKTHLFSERSTARIVDKINEKMIEKKKPTKLTIKNKPINKKEEIVDVVREVRRLSSKNLPSSLKLEEIKHEKLINLAIYENKKMEKMKKLIKVKALKASNSKEYFVTKTTLKNIRNEARFAGGYVHIIDEKKGENRQNEVKNNLFAWPSTEVKGTGFNTDIGDFGLNEMSPLRRMGYQITDSTRQQRWLALQRAVPSIGLKKVAYTIAGNIKLRKGQKNGLKKFSYSISEWEYDLNRLKNKFYKHDFKWPNI